jgi:hypothetical protein
MTLEILESDPLALSPLTKNINKEADLHHWMSSPAYLAIYQMLTGLNDSGSPNLVMHPGPSVQSSPLFFLPSMLFVPLLLSVLPLPRPNVLATKPFVAFCQRFGRVVQKF